jgi:hypothetical protein
VLRLPSKRQEGGSPVTGGAHTMWALYFGDANYAASVDSDPLTV